MTTDHAMILQQDLAQKGVAPSRPSAVIPPEAMVSFREGLEHFQAGDAKLALGAFSRSVLQAPEFAEAHIFLGLANALTSNIYPALDHLEKATQLQPDSFAAHFTLAQLNFKLRTPKKGYDAARAALRCATTLEQRTMLTQLLKEERSRERNGIARPSFDRPWFKKGWFKKRFGGRGLMAAGGDLAAAFAALIVHAR